MHPSSSKLYSPPSDDLPELERTLLRHLNAGSSKLDDLRDLGSVLERMFIDAQQCTTNSLEFADWVSDGFGASEPEHLSSTHLRVAGSCYWLDGGDGCERFSFDLDSSREPLRYSFKFTGGRRARQVLYIAKTDDGWYANAT